MIFAFWGKGNGAFGLAMPFKNTPRSAFTLLEILVVVAIIALLSAILFPAFARARQKARDTNCLSNMKQIGLGVLQYVQDYDETWPIFYAYNSSPASGNPGHKGIELELQPYTKSLQIFKCPNDVGGPTVASDGDCALDAAKQESYAACYGSSYRFTSGAFSVVAGESSANNAPLLTTALVRDSMFQVPAQTRVLRDEMLPWFGPEFDAGGTKYGYVPTYYHEWHPTGGSFLFADGHAKFGVSAAQFDTMWLNPEATKSWATTSYDGD